MYENTGVMPRAFVVGSWIYAQDMKTQSRVLLSGQFDPRQVVILDSDLKNIELSARNSIAEITKYKNNRVEINTKMDGVGILVLSDSNYPGWRVYIDGVENKIINANINSRAVVVPEGEHRVEFNFEPKSFKWGFLISTFTIILLLVILTKEVKRKNA